MLKPIVQNTTESQKWVHGPDTTRRSVKVYGTCYHSCEFPCSIPLSETMFMFMGHATGHVRAITYVAVWVMPMSGICATTDDHV